MSHQHQRSLTIEQIGFVEKDLKDGKKFKVRKVRNPEKVYQLLEVIGEGGFGVVYKAVSKKNGQTYAIKVVRLMTKKDYISMEREIRLLKKLHDCEQVVKYFDSFFHKRKLWIVIEFCSGGSLDDILDVTKKPFEEKEISAICREVLLGIKYLHSNKIIHRDIKAANILCTSEGKIKLVDFGISRQLNRTISRAKSFVGSPYHMAPEVVMSSSGGTYNKSVDIWSVGITLIQLAEVFAPRSTIHPMRVIFTIINEPSPTLQDESKWSSELKEFLGFCVSKFDEDRKTAEELLEHEFIQKHLNVHTTTFLPRYILEMEQKFTDAGGKREYYKKEGGSLRYKKVSKEVEDEDTSDLEDIETDSGDENKGDDDLIDDSDESDYTDSSSDEDGGAVTFRRKPDSLKYLKKKEEEEEEVVKDVEVQKKKKKKKKMKPSMSGGDLTRKNLKTLEELRVKNLEQIQRFEDMLKTLKTQNEVIVRLMKEKTMD